MITILTHISRVRSILALLLFLSSASLWAQSDDATLTNITTLAQLDAIRYDLNGDGMVDASASMADSISYETAFSLARKGSITCTGGCSGYELRNNLDFAGTKWENPTGGTFTGTHETGGWALIGYFNDPPYIGGPTDFVPYTATFDGNGNTISNLYINRPSTSYVGLFGFLGNGSNLRNLRIEGGSVTGNDFVGGLVGRNVGTISACYATGNVNGADRVGGLVGENDGTISDCYATGDVSGTGAVGGLVGENGPQIGVPHGGTISDCYATGDVNGANAVGGLVGWNFDNGGTIGSTISACYATGDATGTATFVGGSYVSGGVNIGGLVGQNEDGTISACYATGNATGANKNVGGLVGFSTGTISACYATGDASASGSGYSIGGLVGENSGTISACYARGNATGVYLNVGGLVGENDGTVSACYATGDATTGFTSVGGLVGLNSSTITNSYFDSDASNRPVADDYAKTTTQLQTPTAYGTSADIYANWNIDVDDGQPIGVDNGTAAGDAAADDPWAFGTDMEYPALKVDFDVDGTPSVVEFGTQPRTAPPATVPDAPTSFTATAANTEVTLNWTPPSDIGGAPILSYELQYDTDMNFNSSTTVSTMTESWTVSSLANGTLYYFRVAAVNSVGTGAPAEVSATPATVPDAPTALTATAANTEVTLNWTAPVNNGGATITGYKVEYSVHADFSSSSTADASTLSYTASGLANGTLYYFRVAAVNSAGTGAPAEVSATPVVPLAISSISPTSGAVGETVMITGTGFSTTAADNTVTFLGEAGATDNAVVMTVSAATAISLSVTVPSGAVTGKIQVEVNSVVAVSSDDFTVLMSVPPTDTDADGLIDITTLAQLDAIRYDLDGDGRPTSAGQTAWQAAFSAVVTVDDDAAVHDGSSSFTGYELMSNLDFAGTKWENPTVGTFTGTHETGGWAPLGYYNSSTDNASYTATFDGRDYTISNLYINRPSTSSVGLFGVLGAGGNLRNLGIEGGSLSGSSYVGRLVGFNGGTISACYATGDASGTNRVGGLVGQNGGTISACYSTGNASGSGFNIGGLVGENEDGTISACYATGTATGSSSVGGLVGSSSSSTISACYSTGDATGSSSVGGLVGSSSSSSSTISACYSTGDATGTGGGFDAGGLVGNNGGTISACYATGNATGSSNSVGGLVGNNSGTITNSYFDSTVNSALATTPIGGGTTTGSDITNVSGKTTTELQTPTAYTTGLSLSIYSNWDIDVDNADTDDDPATGTDDPWAFGTSSQYPALQVDFNVDGTPSVAEFGTQPRTAPATAPAAPTALTATAGNTEVTLNWTAPVNNGGATITGYKVEYSVHADFSSSSTADASTLSYTASGLTNGTLYYFKVAAVNSVGTGAPAEVSATPAAPATVPDAPTALTATAGNTEVTLNWTAPVNDGGATITGYMIEYSVNTDFSSSTTADASTLSYTASGLANGTLYYFRVAAVNSAGTSAYHPGTPGTAVSATPALPAISSISPTSGPVGETVMITGTSFSTTAADNAVTFLGSSSPGDEQTATVNTASATELTVTVPSGAVTGKIQVEVNSVVAVSTDDFTVLMSVPPTDMDADGLIDITTLAQLDAIHYDLDGDGRPTSAGQTAWQAAFSAVVASDDDVAVHDGSSSFTGYELMNNLDFAGTKWENPTGGAFTGTHETGGWDPLGYYIDEDDLAYYTATFDGRDYTISNLYINRPSTTNVGLFGVLGTGSNVRNLGIEGGSLTGNGNVGGLVGFSFGTIRACYATGNATGTGNNVGGLVGRNNGGTISACYATGNASGSRSVGGLVGQNNSAISACYATGDASGSSLAGGLVGGNAAGGTISACYATGNASGGIGTGGLVGDNAGTISACYATGTATGTAFFGVGGLVGTNFSGGTETNSYFDSETSGIATGAGAKTTTQLQTPTAYTTGLSLSIYSNWDIDVDNGQPIGVDDGTAAGDPGIDDPWDFGTSSQYPALQVDFDRDGTASVVEFGDQGRAAPATVPDAPSALTATAGNTEVTLNWTAPANDGGATITGYMVEYSVNTDFSSSTTADASTLSYTASGLANGTLYYFRVAAVNSAGTSAYHPGATDPAVSATPAVPLAISSISPTSGLVGETVMITGTSFSTTAAENTVTFLGHIDAAADNRSATVSAATTTELTVTVPPAAQTGPISVMVGAVADTSSQDYTVLIGEDKDTNGNGLIEVSSLEQLDAIRYDLNGDGVPSGTNLEQAAYRTAFGLSGAATIVSCTGGCEGYELMNDLDFEDANGNGTADDKSIWAEGATTAGVSGAVAEGWALIGYYNSFFDNAPYTATFDGRGHTISNLYINRPNTSNVGLFGNLEGNVRNLGIEGGSVTGYDDVGGLVGRNNGGAITNGYATGNVTGTGVTVGGLVGRNLNGTISACYATGNAEGSGDNVGGLVGDNNGTISACYATGDATGSASGFNIGGLVGENDGTISACYAMGAASGGFLVGGLVGINSSTITNSYFDSETSGIATGTGAKTTTQLQTPIAYGTAMEIYANWNIDIDNADADNNLATGTDDPWDFGTSSQYPALKVDFDGNSTATADEFGPQRTTRFLSIRYMFDVVPGISVGSEVGTVVAVPADFNNTLSYTILSQTLNGAAVSYFLIANTAIGTISVADPAPTEVGIYTLSVEVSDGEGGTATTEVIINLNLVSVLLPMSEGEFTACSGKFTDTGGSGNYNNDEGITMTISPESATDRVRVEFTSFDVEDEATCDYDKLEVYNGATRSATLIGTYCGTNSPGVVLSSSADGKLTFYFESDFDTNFSGWEATISCVPAPATVPDAPTALTATAGNTEVTLNWTAPVNDGGATITSYMIEYSVNEDFSSSSTADASTLSYTASSLANGTLYYFRVAAVNSAGTSAYYPGATDPAVSATPAVSLAISSISPTSGAVGETVMITGTGFSTTAADNAVTFLGDINADADNAVVITVSAATAFSLSVTVPSGAMTGKISVMVGSAADTSSQDFTVLIAEDKDENDNGLIEVSSLEQLDAIRYDLDGDGTPSGTDLEQTAYRTAFGLSGAATIVSCTGGCSGYELMSNLDFEDANGNGTADDKSIWAEGAGAAGISGAVAEGWEPIGYYNSFSDNAPYTATFDGRGHTISNLYINRPSTNNVGLFGFLGTGGNVRNLGIEGGSLSGDGFVGGLVGRNSFGGTISACYATGNASGSSPVGGLVGFNGGTISACYATGDATGTGNNVGGLVGDNFFGTIIACYATGNASGSSSVGGLVGNNSSFFPTISACYATGNATGTGSNVGGLVGGGGTVTNSYFDSSVSNRPNTDDYAKTTAELQTPMAYADIYANWNIDVDDGQPIGVDDGTAAGDSDTDDPWDFGTNMQYPALQVDFDRNGTPSVAEFGMQPRTAFFRVSGFTPERGVVGATVTIRGRLFSTTAADNTVTFLGAEGDADNAEATVSTSPAPTASSLTVTAPPDAQTGPISVMVGTAADTSSQDFTVLIGEDKDENDNGLIEVRSLEQLDAIRYDLDGDGIPSGTDLEQTAYRTAFGISGAATAASCTGGCVGYELMNNLDFEDANGDGTADDKSIWAEGANGAGISGAVAEGWALIGYYNSPSDNASYTATFDGRSHTISNLYINRPSTNNVGLFGFLGTGSNLRNLGIEGGSLTGNDTVGGLVGFNGGTISTCYATGNASGASDVGGLVGGNSGAIRACYATGNATGTNQYVGGIVGQSSGTISACYATGNANGARSVGGLVGYNNFGTISACYATGNASGNFNVGGLVGRNSIGTISACYATGNASGGSFGTGGLVGSNFGTVTNSYFDYEASNRPVADSYSKTTAQLQTPTAYGTSADIYANWNIDVDNGQPIGVDDGTAAGDSDTDNPWDFGTDSEYPALRADFNVNGTPTAFEFGGQGRAVPATVPDAPASLMATAGNAEVALIWTAPANDGGAPITSYMIEHSVNAGFSSSTTVSTAGAVTSYIVSSLANGTLYYFRVAAVNSAGTGVYYPGASDPAVSATPATVPDAPTALTATAADAAVALIWTPPSDNGGATITGYKIEHSVNAGFSSPTTVTTADVSYTVTALTNGTLYYFRVAAVNAAGTGAYYPGASDPAVSATPVVPATPATVPDAPASLMATAADAAVALIWTAPANDGGAPITSYMIEHSVNAGFSSSTTVSTAGAATSYTVSTLANGTLYYFRVAAVNSAGTGVYYPGASDPAVSATPATVPDAPTALTATAADAAVALIWTPPSDNGGATITGYKIEHSVNAGFSSPTTVTTADVSYTVTALTNGTLYYFRVAAVNAAGTGAYYPGASDPAVSATPVVPATPATVPDAPASLMATAADAAVALIWTAPANDGGAPITSYMIEHSVNAGFSSPTTVTTAGAATSYTVSTLANGTLYYFRVAAVNSAGTGVYYPGASDPAVSATPVVPATPATVPDAPASLMATAADAAVALIWTAPANDGGAPITSYMIEHSVNAGFSSPTTVTTAGAATSYTVSTLTNGTLYYFRVAAVNSAGTGAYYPGASDPAVSATPVVPATPATVPDAPASLMATAADAAVALIWTAPANDGGAPITSYMIEHSVNAGFSSPTTVTTAGAATSYTVSTLTNGTLYYFRVAAVNSAGTGAYYPGASDPAVSATPVSLAISSISPTSGAVGTTVTITGTGFSTTAAENTVTFLGDIDADADNVVATVSAATAASLTVTVPPDAQTGTISVMVGTEADTSDMSFRILDPNVLAITGINPTSGTVGASVTISGQNFSTTAGENTVTFLGDIDADADNVVATVSAATAASLTVTVPPDTQTGTISVMVGSAADTSEMSFRVLEPNVLAVSDFTPTSGPVNTEVKIWGTGFSSTVTEDSVSFGGSPYVVASSFIADTRTGVSPMIDTLVVSVPSDAQTGMISVMVGTVADTSDASFTVEPAVFSVPLSSEGDVRVYPNPTLGQLHFKGLLASGRYVCDLYSLVGQKVLSSVVRAGDMMDTSTLSSGQYILILQAEGRELMRTRLLVLK